MTLHELIKQISAILTPETDRFFDYVIHTSDDDGGFLRTCYCYKDHPLRDKEIKDLKETEVCFLEPFREHDLGDGESTLVKLQLDYDRRREWSSKDFIAWSWELGYRVAYLFDLEHKTYQVEERPECPLG